MSDAIRQVSENNMRVFDTIIRHTRVSLNNLLTNSKSGEFCLQQHFRYLATKQKDVAEIFGNFFQSRTTMETCAANFVLLEKASHVIRAASSPISPPNSKSKMFKNYQKMSHF